MKQINLGNVVCVSICGLLFIMGIGLIVIAFKEPHKTVVHEAVKVENEDNGFKVFHVGPHIGFDGKLRIGPGLGIGLGGF